MSILLTTGNSSTVTVGMGAYSSLCRFANAWSFLWFLLRKVAALKIKSCKIWFLLSIISLWKTTVKFVKWLTPLSITNDFNMWLIEEISENGVHTENELVFFIVYKRKRWKTKYIPI